MSPGSPARYAPIEGGAEDDAFAPTSPLNAMPSSTAGARAPATPPPIRAAPFAAPPGPRSMVELAQRSISIRPDKRPHPSDPDFARKAADMIGLDDPEATGGSLDVSTYAAPRGPLSGLLTPEHGGDMPRGDLDRSRRWVSGVMIAGTVALGVIASLLLVQVSGPGAPPPGRPQCLPRARPCPPREPPHASASPSAPPRDPRATPAPPAPPARRSTAGRRAGTGAAPIVARTPSTGCRSAGRGPCRPTWRCGSTWTPPRTR